MPTKKQRKDKSVSSGLVTITTNLARSEVKEDTLNGRPHLSAPVMMIKAPIVMNGLLYPVDEVQKFVEAWNGRPVTLFHPKSAEGEYISANSPEVVNSVQLGQIFGAQFNDGLRAEAWVDVEKARTVRPEVLDFYEGRRQNLEVSTGLFGDVVRVVGDLNGVAYEGIMTNIRPDHLALLPGGEGACSWTDGCGLRANEGEDVDKIIEFRKQQYLQANASTLKGIMEAMRKAVDGMDDRNYVHYFRDATVGRNPYVIYTKEKRWVEGQPPVAPTTYRQTYEIDGNGVVALTGTPEEVVIQTTYVTVSEKQEDEKNMKTNEQKRKEKVDALIACQRCKYAEKDREFLMGLNEEQLELITPPENVVLKANEEQKPESAETKPSGSDKEPHGNEKPQNAMAWLNSQENMPEAVKETLRESMLTNETIKIELVTNLVKHPRNKFTQDQLMSKSVSDLKMLSELAGPIPNEKPEDAAPSFFGLQASTFQAKWDEQKAPEPMVAPNLVACLKEDRLKK